MKKIITLFIIICTIILNAPVYASTSDGNINALTNGVNAYENNDDISNSEVETKDEQEDSLNDSNVDITDDTEINEENLDTDETLDSGDETTEKGENDDYSEVLNIIDMYFLNRANLLNAEFEQYDLSFYTTSGVVDDELQRADIIKGTTLNLSQFTYCIASISSDYSIRCNVIETYTAESSDGTTSIESIDHKIEFMLNETNDPILVRDQYKEPLLGFSSCSYVDEEAASEAISAFLSSNDNYLTESDDFENTWVNTQYQIDDIIGVAETQLGYTEEYDNITKYGDWYPDQGAQWCGMFVSWCANQAGISTSIIPKYESVSTGRNWFINNGDFHSLGTYTPKPGDIFFQSQHTGIVTGVSGGYVYAIAGNSANSVAIETYSLTDSSLVGFASPKYKIPAPTLNTLTVNSASSISLSWSSVADATGYLVYRSTSLSSGYSLVVNTASTSYTDTGLSANTTYYYVVYAYEYFSNGSTIYSDYYNCLAKRTWLATPTITGATIGTNRVTLTWNSISGATAYKVYRSRSSGSGYSIVGTTSSCSFTNTGVSGIYYYKIQAESSSNGSALSNYKKVTIS